MTDGIYSIGALGRMLGVSPTTLRSWEDRYGVVVPDRSAGAQRLYSRKHLEQLRFVCTEMEHGLSAADAHRLLVDRLASGTSLAGDVGNFADRHILLVERDPYAAELAEYFLRTEGYGVSTARTARAATESINGELPDLAILDLMIDGGAGLRLCATLRDVVRMVAVSALDQRDKALAAGADAFVRKPFEALTLVSATRDLIGTSAIVRNRARVPQD